MDFQHEPGRIFKTAQDGRLLAELTYQSIDDGKAWAVDHTFVDEGLRGQGIAGQLIEAVVAAARQEGKTIEPLCSYAVHAFHNHPEYADVLRPVKGN
ncbi:GNAT family N-acetyltransferase [Lacticaseibacillus chiayiensis]|uniref:N-acetyltransferase n=1 Tax=Lacticaseibacillus chiayiensis TaxID=2100821 RepID=A0A4Q1TMV4_9LACO|nr:GNAT family N-acetyltransferase [Lacticaseibacillus chiayiensis]QVI36061.1 N-acetyltransferase [Lacticaseibacillus chiayiensis]RXT19497.1 GNAT family N-acetyltransferase [Lacticaseibacillus chiayiensis]RXT57898.1 GNAT family N-acetyltransferase [Lacticaseibacillus chiayiensis]UYN57863.1 N-acetyltransferase [Lacticaseibacillus chiayiensis]